MDWDPTTTDTDGYICPPCPVFYPTAEEFQHPLKYISRCGNLFHHLISLLSARSTDAQSSVPSSSSTAKLNSNAPQLQYTAETLLDANRRDACLRWPSEGAVDVELSVFREQCSMMHC